MIILPDSPITILGHFKISFGIPPLSTFPTVASRARRRTIRPSPVFAHPSITSIDLLPIAWLDSDTACYTSAVPKQRGQYARSSPSLAQTALSAREIGISRFWHNKRGSLPRPSPFSSSTTSSTSVPSIQFHSFSSIASLSLLLPFCIQTYQSLYCLHKPATSCDSHQRIHFNKDDQRPRALPPFLSYTSYRHPPPRPVNGSPFTYTRSHLLGLPYNGPSP